MNHSALVLLAYRKYGMQCLFLWNNACGHFQQDFLTFFPTCFFFVFLLLFFLTFTEYSLLLQFTLDSDLLLNICYALIIYKIYAHFIAIFSNISSQCFFTSSQAIGVCLTLRSRATAQNFTFFSYQDTIMKAVTHFFSKLSLFPVQWHVFIVVQCTVQSIQQGVYLGSNVK